jgi:methyl-accepting chemotaxis protein
MLLGTAFATIWPEAEGVGQAFSMIGSLGMIVGNVLTMLPGIISAVGSAFSAVLTMIESHPIIAIISAILLALIVTITLVVSAINKKERELEERSKNLGKAIETLSSSIDETKDKIEELGEKARALNDLKDTMDGLVKGTKEWRKALLESNSQVLTLLETYPELSDYINTDADGLMTIA